MKITLFAPLLFFLLTNVNNNQPLVIYDQGQPIKQINKSDFQLQYLEEPFLNVGKYISLIDALEKQVYVPPRDATLDKYGNIISSEQGYRLDKEAFHNLFYRYYSGQILTHIDIPKKPAYPRVDDETLANIKVKLIGKYITYYRPTNEERSHNIYLSAKAIDNHVVFPGERFSFNKVVGKRTKEKGYMPAPEIVEGELSEGIGGGICQVSSTLFNAVDNAGVMILERYSHSRNVAYVPSGRDATVSWNGPDFTFKNNYNQPILIRTKAYYGTLVVKIYSSDSIQVKNRDIPSASDTLPHEVHNPYLH